MIISKIKLKNYRNYNDIELNLDKNINILIGDNAQGKTNILESIYVLGLTKSFLYVNDRDLIKKNNLFLRIEGNLITKTEIKKLELLINENEKRVKINNNEVEKITNYISNLNVIIFSPDTFIMLKEGPSARRKYFNIEISQIHNRYLKTLMDFNNILKKRNEYLKLVSKNFKINESYLDILNETYATLAIDVFLYRKKYIEDISDILSKKYNKFFKNDILKLKYMSNIKFKENKKDMKDNLILKLNKNIKKEIIYKQSLYGPQRDDILLMLNDQNIIKCGSQGQIKMALFSLKLTEVEVFYKYRKEYPILLLDDILSELDSKKVNVVLKSLNKNIQIILTTPDILKVDKVILDKSKIFNIKNGKIINYARRSEKNEK